MSVLRSAAAVLSLAIAAAAAFAEPPAAVPARVAARLDASSDRLVRRAHVPSEADKVGEVRILRRGDADVVQTLLYSKILGRVVAEIGKKELANWPEGQPGHEDARDYVAMLRRVQKQIWNRMPRHEAGVDRRQKMAIEFVLAPDAALVAAGPIAIVEDGGAVQVTHFEPLAVIEPSRAYVERNMRLIEDDAFAGAE